MTCGSLGNRVHLCERSSGKGGRSHCGDTVNYRIEARMCCKRNEVSMGDL